MNDRSSLDGVQLDQYDALMRAYMHICDTMYYQAQVGAGDHGLWKAEERYLGVILNSNGGAAWLEENSLSISADFRKALDEIIPLYRSSEAEETDPLSLRCSSLHASFGTAGEGFTVEIESGSGNFSWRQFTAPNTAALKVD